MPLANKPHSFNAVHRPSGSLWPRPQGTHYVFNRNGWCGDWGPARDSDRRAFAPELVGGAGPDEVWRGLATVAGSWIGGGAICLR